MMHGTYDQAIEGFSPPLLAEELEDKKGREEFEASRKRMAPLFKGIQIVAKKSLADDKVELKMWMDSDSTSGQQCGEREFVIQPMVKIGDAWRLGGGTMGHQEAWDEDPTIQTFAP